MVEADWPRFGGELGLGFSQQKMIDEESAKFFGHLGQGLVDARGKLGPGGGLMIAFDGVGDFAATSRGFAAKRIKGEMGGGTMQPAAEVLPDLVRPAHQAEKSFLGEVLRPRPIPNNAQAGGVDKTGIALNDLGESLRIAESREPAEEGEIVVGGGWFTVRRTQAEIWVNGNRHLPSIRNDGAEWRSCRTTEL